MAQNTKIKKDKLGLYTICGGYISRPFYGTIFKEDDEVKTHHFNGSTQAGVTIRDKPETHNFRKDGIYEIWGTTGLSSVKYKLLKNSDFNKITEQTNWYKQNMKFAETVYKEFNSKFTK